MRWQFGTRLGMVGCLLVTCQAMAAAADADVVRKQKETAQAHWREVLSADAPIVGETAHFILFAPSTTTIRQIRDLGGTLEKQLTTARMALKLGADDVPWPGKMVVYLLPTRQSFNTFMRLVAKKRPTEDDVSVFGLGETPFVAAGPVVGKNQPNREAQAAEQIAAAVLVKKQGEGLPGWLVAGFGRATAWHAAPTAHQSDRAAAKKLVRYHSAMEVWNDQLRADEAPVLRASLVEFLAYGPGAPQFSKLLDGFKPGANGRPAAAMAAFMTVDARFADKVSRAWPAWVMKSR